LGNTGAKKKEGQGVGKSYTSGFEAVPNQKDKKRDS
jgi:hypothetical protein